jgi:hypothetical protein
MAIFNSYVQFPEGTSLHIPTSDDSLGFHPIFDEKGEVASSQFPSFSTMGRLVAGFLASAQ